MAAYSGAYYFNLAFLSLRGPINLGFSLYYGSDFSPQWFPSVCLPNRFWWSPLETLNYAFTANFKLVTAQIHNGDSISFKWDGTQWIPSGMNDYGYADNVRYTYNTRDWQTGLTDAGGQVWSTGYDDEGVPASQTTPLGFNSTFQTNKLGLPTRVTNPLGQFAGFAYDALSRLTSTTDAAGRTTTYGYNAAGQLAMVTRSGVGSATYARNDSGLVTRITDPRGKNWDFGHSTVGRRTSHTDPLGNRWAYAYDSHGRPAQTTYPSGTTATYTYDAAGQVTQIAYPGGLTLNYGYDAAGRLTAANNIALTYDAQGDVTNSQDGGASFGATYDNGGRIATVTYDGQATVTYTYNSRNLVTRVTDSRSGVWVNFFYDNDGRLTGITRWNAVDTAYGYDNAGRVTRIQEGTLSDQKYTLNGEGEVTQSEGKLPLTPAATAQIANYSYDDASQISGVGYAYDARGRQTAAPGKTFAYDGAGRLTQATAGGSTVNLAYNGLNDLRSRTVGGTTVTYYHNYALGMSPIVAEKEGGAYKRFYMYTPLGELLYSVDAASGAARFYHFDRVGSTLFITDGAGSVSDAFAYDPYGRPLGSAGSSDQPFTYVGRYGVRWEPVGGLYDMRARAYDPAAARFLTRDPVWPNLGDPRDLNPYQYAYQNPLRYIDPLGRQAGYSTYWLGRARQIVRKWIDFVAQQFSGFMNGPGSTPGSTSQVPDNATPLFSMLVNYLLFVNYDSDKSTSLTALRQAWESELSNIRNRYPYFPGF